MRIAFFVQSLSVGGAETIACNYLLKLKEFGHDVILIQKRNEDTFLNKKITEAGIPTYTLTPSGRDIVSKGMRFLTMKFFIGVKLSRLLKKLKVEIFHNHISFEGVKKLPVPVNNIYYSVHTDVGRTFEIYGKSHYKNAKRFIEKGINVVVVTERMKKDLLSFFPTAKYYLLGNGVDTKKIRNLRYDRKEFLNSIGINENCFVMGHIGRYFPVKNHHKVIEIFSEVKRLRPNSKLLLVGTGNEQEKATVNALIQKYRVQEDVIQLGLRDDATAVISVLDALVLPSFNEGFGLVVLEAQVHDIRCVVSNAVQRDLACNGNVFFVDIKESSEKWAKILLNNNRTENIKDVEEYSIDNIVKQQEKIYMDNL